MSFGLKRLVSHSFLNDLTIISCLRSVIQGFTGFYWVLLGFLLGFYWGFYFLPFRGLGGGALKVFVRVVAGAAGAQVVEFPRPFPANLSAELIHFHLIPFPTQDSITKLTT